MTLAWTIVGSCAGVAGVAVAVATARRPSSRRLASKISAELGRGQLGKSGVLSVEFDSGAANILTLPDLEEAGGVPLDSSMKDAADTPEFTTVIAIFIHNRGQTGVTLSRCQYSGILGTVSFDFEPQAGASERGDHLPKYIGPGEEVILVHNWTTMRVFLNQVMLDHDAEMATFQVFIILGNGARIAVSSQVHVHADMSEDDVTTFLAEHRGNLERQVLEMPNSSPILLPNGRWRWHVN